MCGLFSYTIVVNMVFLNVEEEMIDGTKIKILVVDDEDRIRRLLKMYLRKRKLCD